ncbi:MAG: DUF3592 domain-containing protein [Fibrobacteria bacterium]|nr:DUF3592 domain-containing protein [Fibrobacteria bacterium]
MSPFLWGTVFSLAFGLPGVILLRLGWARRRFLGSFATWPRVEVEVVESSAKRNHKARIRYRYLIDGIVHESSGIHPGHILRRPESLESKLVDHAKPGTRLRAWVDPSDPDTAFLAVAPLPTDMTPLVLGLGLTLAAAGIPLAIFLHGFLLDSYFG